LKHNKHPSQLLLESVRILDGQADLLPFHQRRVDRSRRALFAKSPALKLDKVLAGLELPRNGLFKLRIEYAETIHKTELVPYVPKIIKSLRLVDANALSYGQKFTDRTGIRQCLEKKGNCDDILMVQYGYLTDASYANVALFDGSYWYTPSWPLLRGTRRESLLESGVLKPTVIRARDLDSFSKIRLINAMLPWEEAMEVAVDQVMGR